MSTNGLGRRLDALEETATRHMVERVAAQYGLDPRELYEPARRMAAEERRLRLRGLSEGQIRRGLVEWIATDLDLDADELEAEWRRDLEERGRWPAA